MTAYIPKAARHDWQTPEWILDRIRDFGPRYGIDVDPATSEDNPTSARKTCSTGLRSGLDMTWFPPEPRRGRVVWVNPPYGRALSPWSIKIASESKTMQPEDQMFALVPSRTDTAWCRTMREASRSAAFFYGRIKFKGADQGAPFPSVLFYFGDTPSRFWHRFSDVAWVVDTGGNR